MKAENFHHPDGRWAKLWSRQLAIKGKNGTRTIRTTSLESGRRHLKQLGFISDKKS